MAVGGGVESDTRNLGPRAQAWDGRWARGRATADHRGGGVVKSPDHSANAGSAATAGPRCAYHPAPRLSRGVWARLARGAQKTFHMNQKIAEASLILPCLPRDQELPRTASTLKFPLSQSVYPMFPEKRQDAAL